MFSQKLPTPQVIPGGITQIPIRSQDASLVGLNIRCSGTTFDVSHIQNIKIKVGPKTIWEVDGPDYLKIYAYKGGSVADNKILDLDFVERTQALFPLKEVGAISLPDMRQYGDVVVELKVSATAVNPMVQVTANMTGAQKNELVMKLVPFTFAQSMSGNFSLPVNPRGSIIKRVWIFYSGTDWTPTANGNLSNLVVKKNGLVLEDRSDIDLRFLQSKFRKVPQSRVLVYDPIVDDNHDAHVRTQHAVGPDQYVFDQMEFVATIADVAGSQCRIYLEVLDKVPNL